MNRRQDPSVPRIGVALSLALAVLAGCGGGGGSSNGGGTVPTGRTGRLQVGMTDATSTYASVVLAIEEVRLVPAGHEDDTTSADMTVLASFTPARTVDVVELDFQQELLGEAVVPVGSYQQLRLVLEPNPATGPPVNFVTMPGDPTPIPLKTPSGQESGLKVNGRFDVAAGVVNAVLLDFVPAKAIVAAGASGNLILKPTGIGIVQVAELLDTFGSFSSSAAPAEAWVGAVVRVYAKGSTTAIASGVVNPDDGTFRVFVPAGTYYFTVTAVSGIEYDSRDRQPPNDYVAVSLGVDTPVLSIGLVALVR